jgi:DNA-binding transcriptional MocR family regulator
MAKKVVFVPGDPFFVNGSGQNTMRLSFSKVNQVEIEQGIRVISDSLKEMLLGTDGQ